jgi:predicted HTH transcriptional regulator
MFVRELFASWLTALRRLIDLGETSTVELKVVSPRPDEMAERLCGLANAQGGFIIIGIENTSLLP